MVPALEAAQRTTETTVTATQVPTAAKVKELQRECGLRRSFYPKLIAAGKLDQMEARYRLEVMESILDDYRRKDRDERLQTDPKPAP